jgi:hypothetical protein
MAALLYNFHQHFSLSALQSLFDVQLTSLKAFTATAPSSKLDVHPVTARYAQLTASLLLLNADYQVSICIKLLGL